MAGERRERSSREGGRHWSSLVGLRVYLARGGGVGKTEFASSLSLLQLALDLLHLTRRGMDDLLDLDFAAAKPTKQKQTAQSAYSSRTAFDYLAQQQQQRLPSPTPSSLSQPSRATTPLQPAKPQSKPQQSAGGDAFAELFGTSPGGGGAALNGGQGKQLSMQEKLQATKMAGLEAYGGAFSNGGISPISSTGAGGSRAAYVLFLRASLSSSYTYALSLSPTARRFPHRCELPPLSPPPSSPPLRYPPALPPSPLPTFPFPWPLRRSPPTLGTSTSFPRPFPPNPPRQHQPTTLSTSASMPSLLLPPHPPVVPHLLHPPTTLTSFLPFPHPPRLPLRPLPHPLALLLLPLLETAPPPPSPAHLPTSSGRSSRWASPLLPLATPSS